MIARIALLMLLVAACGPVANSGAAEPAGNPAPAIADAKPVSDMHLLMEYVFEPNYKQLHQHLATPPADKPAWKPVKAASLTLAEGGNLLLLRLPEEGSEEWSKLATAVRDRGGELFQAARDQDYPAARRHYLGLLERCNACHTRFAEGEHQLEP